MGAQEFVGAAGVVGSVGVEVDTNDVAVDGFVEGFEVAGAVEQLQGEVGVGGDLDLDEVVDRLEVAAAGGLADGVGPCAGDVGGEGAFVERDGDVVVVAAQAGVGVAGVGPVSEPERGDRRSGKGRLT